MALDPPYRRQYNDNLWNEKYRLSPGCAKYHISEHTFRTHPQKLELIEMLERENAL